MGKRSSIGKDSPSTNKRATMSKEDLLSKESISILSELAYKRYRLNFESLTKLVELYDPLLEKLSTEEGLNKYESIARLLNVQIMKIFEDLFNETDYFNPSKTDVTVVKKIRHIYEIFKFNLLFLLENIVFDCTLLLDDLNIYMKLLRLESVHLASVSKDGKKSPFFPTKTYRNLIVSLLKSQNGEILSDGTSSNVVVAEFIYRYYNKYDDLQFYFVNELSTEELKDAEPEQVFSKFLTIMREKVRVIGSEEVSKTFISNLPSVVTNEVHYKSAFEAKWLHFLNSNLSNNQYKTTLLILHKRIIPYLMKPTRLMDFLTDSYEVGGVVSVLSLNGLFELMKKYNLDYPNFYEKLYSLFDKDLFHVKYRSRFIRLADVFLSSTHLPSAIVASFLKKMARLSLNASPSAIVSVIPFTYNLLKKHPTCMILLQNTTAPNDYADPFDDTEKDPLKTRAIESSLWELETLQSHYHPNVATLARIFSQPFRKQSYNMEDFLDWSYTSLLESENTRRLKTDVALEYDSFDTLLGDYVKEWEW